MSGASPNVLEHGLDRVLHAVARRQIGGDRATPLVRLLAEHVAVLIADQDVGAFAREQIGDRLADAVRSGAHVGGLAAQLIVHLCPRPSVALATAASFRLKPEATNHEGGFRLQAEGCVRRALAFR